MKIKAYKGFNKDMTCRGFQYAEKGTYETDRAELDHEGFHACINPLDIYKYYIPGSSKYHEVEIEDNGQRKSYDTKIVGKKIKIGAKLTIPAICKAHFEYVKSQCHPVDGRVAGEKESVSVGDRGSASAGECGSAAAGDEGSAAAGDGGSAAAGDGGSAAAGNGGSAAAGYKGSAAAGNWGSAAAGDEGSASAGECGSAAAGDEGSAAAGDGGSAAAGYKGSAAAGNGGSASAGDRGSAASRGVASVGKNGAACVRGNSVKAKGALGAIIVIAVEKDNAYDIKEWKAGVIDGKILKENVWYTLENGEFVEVSE